MVYYVDQFSQTLLLGITAWIIVTGILFGLFMAAAIAMLLMLLCIGRKSVLLVLCNITFMVALAIFNFNIILLLLLTVYNLFDLRSQKKIQS